ncbi:tryptophan-rich sensory protein [Cohnella sp. GCM10027633]|uniref:tryptophan-rich sensory protein n=1 Tax=unclassified Cohnella TaxID=2636738 RepID=UPI0036331AC0
MNRLNRWLNVLGLAFALGVNGLAVMGRLGGATTEELSEKHPSMVAPADYAFSIWSLIYALSIGFVVYSFTDAGKRSNAVQAIGSCFFLSCLLNGSWLVAWHYEELYVSLAIMLALLLAVGTTYAIAKSRDNGALTTGERWWVVLPFSVYLGWLCVAATVNLDIVLRAAEWDRFGLYETSWSIVLLIAAALAGLQIGRRYADAPLLLAVVWALAAVYVSQRELEATVSNTALACAAVLFLCAVLLLLRTGRKRHSVHIA